MNCLECGAKIIGRSDKKYCDDACRNAYNNKINKDVSNMMRNVNHSLRKNYRLLAALPFKEGKTTIIENVLQNSGFDFEHFTSIKRYKNGSEYRYVYDIGYRLLDDGWILVVHPKSG